MNLKHGFNKYITLQMIAKCRISRRTDFKRVEANSKGSKTDLDK